ncbi:MAG: DUF2178 domain-containing protein [Patescibacteria group bacterium]|nr:DUF2178 domain-containing protein [Patescibacteria group bacterium]
MAKKTFSIYKIIVVIFVAVIVSVSFNYGNWHLPIAALIAVWVSLFILRSRVKEVIADERDYKIAGKASILAMRAYAMFAVIVGLALQIAGKNNSVLSAIGSALLYSAAFLMLFYAISFRIYARKDRQN